MGPFLLYSALPAAFAACVLLYLKQSPSELRMTADKADASIVFDQVVCFGDSITQQSWSQQFGLGAALGNVYQRKLDVINRGLSGYNTAWAIPIAQRWLPQQREERPKIRLMLIWFGANDAALPPSPQSVSLPQFKSNLHTILSLVRSPSSPYYNPSTQFLLLTPPPVDAPTRNTELVTREPPRVPDRDSELTRKYAEAVKEVGKEAGVNVVDTWTAITEAAERDGGLGKYLSDGLHLSGDGYAVVTLKVAEAIKAHLPELHWDALEQVFPHWASIVNEGRPEFTVHSQ